MIRVMIPKIREIGHPFFFLYEYSISKKVSEPSKVIGLSVTILRLVSTVSELTLVDRKNEHCLNIKFTGC